MPPNGLFRVGADGVAERALARGPRRARFAVNTGGEAQKLIRKPARPILHPTRGHVGQNAPQHILDRLSVPDDPEATVGRFARATRRQSVEFHGTVHPLSGRLMSLARGNEISTGGAVTPGRSTTQRLIDLHQRTDSPEVQARTLDALRHTGRLAGPRPISVHNHPLFPGGGTRHLPSAADTGSAAITPTQNRVVSLVPHAPRGAPKTHETKFGHLPGTQGGKTGMRQQERLVEADQLTTPPGLLQQLRRGGHKPLPVQRLQHQMTRAEHAEATSEGGRQAANSIISDRKPRNRPVGVPIATSYDTAVRGLTRPGRNIGREGGFYTSERVRKALPKRIHLERLPRGASEHADARTWPLSLLDEDPRRGVATARRLVAVRRLRYKGDKTNLVHVRKSAVRTAQKTAATFGRAAKSPRYMFTAHPAGVITAAAGGAAVAAPHRTDRSRKVRDTAVGAVAGKVGYQLAGHSAKAGARRSVQWHTRMSEMPAETAAQQERKYQVKQEQKMRGRWQREHGNRLDGEAYRDFPKGATLGDGRFVPHRRAGVFRALGHTHGGRSGEVLSAAVTAAGGITGYRHAARVRQVGEPSGVGKSASYGFQEKRVRPVRAAEFAVGGALVAYGGPRLQMAGPLIRTGAKLVERYGGGEAAAKAVIAAEKARGALIEATSPLEELRRIERVNHAVEVVPRHLRPAVATTVGALLMARAHPVRQPVFVPLGGS